MNDWQIARQAKYLLEQQTWPDSPSGRVFANVRITTGDDDATLTDLRFPMALVSIVGTEADEQNPEVQVVNLRVFVFQHADGGDMVQSALMGGPRTGGVGRSQGRGVLELGEEAMKALSRLTGANGARAAVVQVGAAAGTKAPSGGYVAGREYEVRCYATLRRHYDAPYWLTATAGGAGEAVLTWSLPPARWDHFDATPTRLAPVVRYAAGATAPASATAGTGVAGLTGSSTGVTVTGLAAGAWSFAIFAAYTEAGGSSAERYSEQELSTTKTVTVS